MPKWEAIIDTLHQNGGFTDKAVNMTKKLREEMAVTAAKVGIEVSP